MDTLAIFEIEAGLEVLVKGATDAAGKACLAGGAVVEARDIDEGVLGEDFVDHVAIAGEEFDLPDGVDVWAFGGIHEASGDVDDEFLLAI